MIRPIWLGTWVWLGFSSVLSTTALAQYSHTETEQRTVVTSKDAYIPMPIELASEPVVTDLSISNGGHYALMQRTKSPLPTSLFPTDSALQSSLRPEISLVLWSSRTHRSTTVWKADVDEIHIEDITWLQKSEVAYVHMTQILPNKADVPTGPPESRELLLRVSGDNGRAEFVDAGNHATADMLSITPAPATPSAVVLFTKFIDGGRNRECSLVLLNERGQYGAQATLAKGSWTNEVNWSENGEPVIQLARWSPDHKHVISTWSTMNPATGELTVVQFQPSKGQALPSIISKSAHHRPLPVALKSTRTVVKEQETTQPANLLWLESTTVSEKPRVLLSSDSTGGELMERGEMAIYKSQGAVWAVPLMRIDLAAYAALKKLADRERTVNRAKQAALAVLMCAQDYDETMPSAEGLSTLLAPYTKDPSILDGFNYTYPGGPIGDIANPAETVIGTMNGATGQAVVYADGHVKWR